MTTFTPNLQLGQPQSGDRTWNVPLNANATTLDALSPIGSLNVTTTEVPSSTLHVAISAGGYLKQDGTVGTYAGISSTTLTASAVNYLYLDLISSGVLVVNTTGFPSTAHVRLATVAAGGSTITNITDARVACNAVGTWADGINLSVGTGTGSQIGTSSSQKIGFYGKTPIVQPTIGAGTASGTYGATEQAMLQAVFNAVRALGLGS